MAIFLRSPDSKTARARIQLEESDAKPSPGADFGNEPQGSDDSGGDHSPHQLKRKTIRGALVSTFGQGANLVLRIGSMMVLARLLAPEDFGLVAMVTACTGFLDLFRDFGLSMLLVLPVIIWATHQSPVTAIDTLKVVLCPFLSILVAATSVLVGWHFIHSLTSALVRLIAANTLLFGIYFVVFWFVMGQKAIYLPMLREVGLWPVAGSRSRSLN